ncbi:MAG TPA: cytochrome c oxidase subunit II [Sphingomicrobium sp.]|nr:cytochrome c oxidase subunit II [Sphingomicrobium sp.]
MKLIGWAIALAAAGLTPAAAQAPSAPSDNVAATAAPAASQDAAPAASATDEPAPIQYGSVGHAIPTPGIGVPDGRKGLQDQVTPVGREAASFHDYWLMPVITGICILVLGLLIYVIARFRRGANPTPSRNSHNTMIEVVWTLVPVLILVMIAIPSIRLLRHQYTPPPADLTVKVTGHQWYWSYEYPDNGISFDSHMLKERDDPTRAKDERWRDDRDGPPMLAADQRLVIPAGKVVKLIITADDVIHSFAVPAFWTKLDANPGQLNETWVKVDRPGVYFGQCSELCGARHAFMPIAVEVVPPAQFAQWVAAKGGTMPGARPAPGTDTTGSSPVSAAATPAVAPAQAPQPGDPAAVKQPATNQAATAQN